MPKTQITVASEATTIVPTAGAKPWAEVFGALPPAPPPVIATDPQPPQIRHDFILKGLFAGPTNSWAIVADQAGEYLLRAGDELPSGAIVSSITTQGVWLKTPQGRALIAFEDQP